MIEKWAPDSEMIVGTESEGVKARFRPALLILVFVVCYAVFWLWLIR